MIVGPGITLKCKGGLGAIFFKHLYTPSMPFCWPGEFFFLYLFYVERNSARKVEGEERQSEDDDYQETDRLLGDEGGSEDERNDDVSIRQRRKKEKKKKQKKPSLAGTLWSALFGMNFAIAIICKLLHDALIFIQPQLLRYM